MLIPLTKPSGMHSVGNIIINMSIFHKYMSVSINHAIVAFYLLILSSKLNHFHPKIHPKRPIHAHVRFYTVHCIVNWTAVKYWLGLINIDICIQTFIKINICYISKWLLGLHVCNNRCAISVKFRHCKGTFNYAIQI